MSADTHFPPVCPKCGAGALCFHEDIGREDFTDEYTLICIQCDHRESQSFSGESQFGDSRENLCPYCGRGRRGHESPDHRLPPSLPPPGSGTIQ